MISFLSPCAFPLLPSYIAYYLAQKEENRGINPPSMSIYKRAVNGAIFGAAAMLGFITVFVALGGTITYGLKQIGTYVPFFPIIIGFGLVVLGLLMFTNVSLSFALPVKTSAKKGYLFFYLYGITYALASLGCSLPIFLMVILSASASGGVATETLVFLLYSLGMGALMILVTLTVSTAKSHVVHHLMSLLPYVRKISAVIIILAGIYLLYYSQKIFMLKLTMPVI